MAHPLTVRRGFERQVIPSAPVPYACRPQSGHAMRLAGRASRNVQGLALGGHACPCWLHAGRAREAVCTCCLGAVARLLRMLLLTANASAQPANARARRTIRDMMLFLIGAWRETQWSDLYLESPSIRSQFMLMGPCRHNINNCCKRWQGRARELAGCWEGGRDTGDREGLERWTWTWTCGACHLESWCWSCGGVGGREGAGTWMEAASEGGSRLSVCRLRSLGCLDRRR